VAARLIALGRVTGPWGVKGWIKVTPYADMPAELCAFGRWWIQGDGTAREFEVVEARPHGASVIARLAGCDDRDAAATLKGREVAVPRDALPDPGEGATYWADLVGLRVVNLRGQVLGEVVGLIATGANDVLRVAGADSERLLPYIAAVVREVDLARGEMRVDWELDW